MVKEFKLASEGNFFERLFGRRYSAAEVDFSQKGAGNEYGQTWDMTQQDFDERLDNPSVPEGFSSQSEWDLFREQKKNRPGGFYPDFTDLYKVLGEENVNRRFRGSDIGSSLLKSPNDLETTKKNLDLERTEKEIDPITGEERFNPAVNTYEIGAEGAVSRRTNPITEDGSNQDDEQGNQRTFGLNDLTAEEFNATMEAARLAKLRESGKYGENFVQGDRLYRSLTTDGTLENAMTGERGQVINLVRDIESLKKNLTEAGIGVTDQTPTTETTQTTSQPTSVAIGSYNPSDEEITKFTEGFVARRSRDQVSGKVNLVNQLKNKRDAITNLENKIARGGNERNLRADRVNLQNKKAEFDMLVQKGTNSNLRSELQTKLNTITGPDKTKYGQLLAGPNFEKIAKNPNLRQEIQNLSPQEFLQKYSKEDGSLDKDALYGNKMSKEASKVLDKNISNKKVDELFAAIQANDQDEIKSILNSVNISEEDQQTLISEAQKTKGDYRSETDIRKKQKIYFATLGSLVAGSPLFNALTSPNNAIANMIETGNINNSGLDALSKQASIANSRRTAAGDLDGYTEFNSIFNDYRNPDNERFGDWDSTRISLGGALRRMRANVATSPTARKISELLNAEKEIARETIIEEGQPGFFRELFTLGFASGPNPDVFGNNIDVGIVPPTATSPDKIRFIVASNGEQISLQKLKRDYGDELAASLISLAFYNNKSKAEN